MVALAMDAVSIPIIDLEPARTGTPEEAAQVAKDVYQAFKNVGFAYIKNHGVSQELIDEAFQWVCKLQATHLYSIPHLKAGES